MTLRCMHAIHVTKLGIEIPTVRGQPNYAVGFRLFEISDVASDKVYEY
ncbi:UNVERIFIED_CONTAM: hypothetical protein ABIC26_000387 [Paenibacillus sp. PvR008]